jgi:hypothetical protein
MAKSVASTVRTGKSSRGGSYRATKTVRGSGGSVRSSGSWNNKNSGFDFIGGPSSKSAGSGASVYSQKSGNNNSNVGSYHEMKSMAPPKRSLASVAKSKMGKVVSAAKSKFGKVKQGVQDRVQAYKSKKEDTKWMDDLDKYSLSSFDDGGGSYKSMSTASKGSKGSRGSKGSKGSRMSKQQQPSEPIQTKKSKLNKLLKYGALAYGGAMTGALINEKSKNQN